MLPEEFPFLNETLDKKQLRVIVSDVLMKLGEEESGVLLDEMKEMALSYITQSGIVGYG